jgi:hypothetical protein
MVLTGTYRELFVAIASCAGALTGLLFVAMSVAPQKDHGSGRYLIQQVRAAAALVAFFNALTVTLFTLVPGTNIGYPATVLGVSGVLFTAAGVRSMLSSRYVRQRWPRQAGLVILLLVIFGAELASGIQALAHPGADGPIQGISYSLVASLLVGVARAWELVGNRDTGIIASIAVLAGRDQHPFSQEPSEPADATEPADAAEATTAPRPVTPADASDVAD